MRHYFSFIFTLLILGTTAQGFKVRHYAPGASTNIANSIFETSPGNYITGGFIVDSLTGRNQLCIMGLGSQGQLLWRKKYPGGLYMYFYNPFISRAFYRQGNNMYYAGCVKDTNNKQIGVLIKFNFNGDTVWQKFYRDPDPLTDVIPQMLTGSVDGGFLLTGFFAVNVATSYRNCMLIKTDMNGQELWRRKISKAVPDVQDGKRILQDSASKKIVIVGYQYIGNANNWANDDNVLILDSLGNKLSQHNFAGFGLGGVLNDMVQTKDKKIVASGWAIYPQQLAGINMAKSYIVKFDLNNPTTPIWKINNFDKLSLDNVFTCLTELGNGDLLVSGVLDTMLINDLPENDLVRLVKIDPAGNITWTRYYDYKTNDSIDFNILAMRSINLCADGSWIGAIEMFNFTGVNPAFFVKYDSTGCDTTLAYCRLFNNVGVKEIKFSSIEINIFPNPTTGVLNITVGNVGENLAFQLTDVTGRLVKDDQILSETQAIDLRDLVNGVYFITVTKNKKTVYQSKLVKQD